MIFLDRDIFGVLKELNERKVEMTWGEMWEEIEKGYEKAEREGFRYIGLRFENKDRRIGDKIESSRHNPDRDDPRDFPEYGSDEYNDLPQFEGTSAWEIKPPEFNPYLWKSEYDDWEDEIIKLKKHCYIIAGDDEQRHFDRDYDEIIIINAEVVYKIY